MKKIFLAFITLLLFISLNLDTFNAASLEDMQKEKSSIDRKKNRLQYHIDQKNTELENNQSTIDSYLDLISTINEELSDIDNTILPLETNIASVSYEVEELYNSILGMEARLEERDRVLRERIRALQANGGAVSYLDVLLGSTSFSDFIDRYSAVSSLLEADREIMKKQAQEQREIEEIRNTVNSQLDELKTKKQELQNLRNTYTSLIEEKEELIVQLEKEQERIDRRLKNLTTDHAEVAKLSADLEAKIIVEQEKALAAARQDLVNTYCTSDGELNLNAFHTKLDASGKFSGSTSTFLEQSQRYNIDPVLMAAIALHETRHGTSNGVMVYNNPGGLMDSATNWSSLIRFDSLNDGLESMAKTLNRIIIKEGKSSLQEIGQVYAPIGAANDPLGLNEHWVPNVTKIVSELGGLTKNCETANHFTLSLSDGTWTTPAAGRLSSHFGWRTHPIEKVRKQHRGMDIANDIGTPIVAAGDGVVTQAGNRGGYGNVVMIMHVVNDQVFTTVYAHMSHINVHEGQKVVKGQPIGQMGKTGLVTGSHLHFEFHEGYYSLDGPSAVNPLRYVPFH